MKYKPDIFYNTSKFSKNHFRKLFFEAKEMSYDWWVDIHPEWTRIKTEMPFEKVIGIFDRTTRKNLHITVIHRMGLTENEKEYLEIGFCTLGRKGKNGDIFLWIEVNLKEADYLLKKYNLITTL